MIKIINTAKSKGFQLKFENNYTVSVLYGAFNGCEYYMDFSSPLDSSKNAEVTVISPKGELVCFGSVSKDMLENVSSEKIAEIISAVQSFKTTYKQSSLEQVLGMVIADY